MVSEDNLTSGKCRLCLTDQLWLIYPVVLVDNSTGNGPRYEAGVDDRLVETQFL